MKHNFKILFIISIISVFLVGCAVDSIKDLVNNIQSNGLHAPKWDIGVKMDMMSKSFSVRELLEDTSLDSMLKGFGGDVSFDKVTKADIEEGGKYYFKDVNNFGLRENDYVMRYPITFPGTENMTNGKIDATMIDQFTNNIVYNMDNLPSWPSLEAFEKIGSITIHNCESQLAKIKGDTSNDDIDFKGEGLNIDLSELNVDIDGKNGNDLFVKGVYSEKASLSLVVIVERYDKTTKKTLETITPKNTEISIDYIQIENVKYTFGEGRPNVDENNNVIEGLIFDAEGFMSSSDNKIMFNGTSDSTGDLTDDYSKLNIDDFSFQLKKGDGSGPVDMVKATVGNYAYRLNVKANIDFGESYNIICDILPLEFDIGSQTFDLSIYSQLDSTDDTKNLGSYFLSSISFENAGIYFNAKSTLPLTVDLSGLFDGKTGNLEINDENETLINTQNHGDGAILTFFDKDGDGICDSHEVLKFNDPTPVEVKGYSDASGDANSKEVSLYRTNSNIDKVLEYEDESNDKLARPTKIAFASYVVTERQNDVKVGVMNMQGGMAIELGLVIPMSFKVVGEKDSMDIISAMGMDNLVSNLTSTLRAGSSVLDMIKSLGINLSVDNGLPFGVKLELLVSADQSDDTTWYFPLFKNDKGYVEIKHGELKTTKDEYGNTEQYIANGNNVNAVLSIGSNFTYYKKTSTGEDILDEKGNPQKFTYSGSFFDFVKNNEDVKLAVNLGLLSSNKDSEGNYIATRLNQNNYMKLSMGLVGSATVDIDALMKPF